jgi:hypothetical protein
MGKVEVVSDLMHLTRYIVTPLIGINRVPVNNISQECQRNLFEFN